MKKLLEKNLTGIITALLLFLILLCEIGKSLEMAFHLYFVLPFAVISILLTLFCSMKRQQKIITIAAAFICGLSTILLLSPEDILRFAHGFYDWLLGISIEETAAVELYQVLLLCFFSAVCFFYQLLAEKSLVLRIATSFALLLWMFVDMFTFQALHHLSVVCALGYAAIAYVVCIQKRWKKQKKNPNRPYLFWILPFLLLYMGLMLAMPAKEEPFSWQFVKDIYNDLSESYNKFIYNWPFGKKEDFQTAVSGFSENGRLLGSIGENNQEMMQIQGHRDLRTNVYLTGKVYDSFNGKEWTQTTTEKTPDRLLDTLETVYAVWQYDEALQLDYIRTTTLNVTYRYFQTGYLFAPLKTWNVKGSNVEYSDEDGNLLLPEIRSYGTTYETFYLQLNTGHPLFYEFLESTPVPDEGTWEDAQRRYNLTTEEHFTLEDLENHQKNIYEIYGATYSVSEEVADYLAQITKGATTDIEKLRAIENALSSFEYTTNPGALPKKVTSPEAFLDYFLLESRKGFCSHFATAFVLLARVEGIPARYVEGFCVPTTSNELTTVYSYMAHAWPEVYIDGIGWIPFEPTPGFSGLRYMPWKEQVHHEPLDIVPTPTPKPTEAPETELPPVEELPPEDNLQPRYIFMIAGYAALVLVAILLLLFLTDRFLSRKRYQKWSLDKKFLAEVQKNLQILSLFGYKRASSETLEELQQRAWALMRYEKDGSEQTLHFLTLYEEFLYNGRTVDESLLQLVCAERAILLEALKKWKYWAYVYYKISHF